MSDDPRPYAGADRRRLPAFSNVFNTGQVAVIVALLSAAGGFLALEWQVAVKMERAEASTRTEQARAMAAEAQIRSDATSSFNSLNAKMDSTSILTAQTTANFQRTLDRMETDLRTMREASTPSVRK